MNVEYIYDQLCIILTEYEQEGGCLSYLYDDLVTLVNEIAAYRG